MSEAQDNLRSWTTKVVLWWVNIYAYSVPKEVASARREELLSDLYEQYAAAPQIGLSQRAVSRVVAWRTVRGLVADLHWGRAHSHRRAGAMRTAAGEHREDRNLFRRGMTILWSTLIVVFLIGLGAALVESLAGGDLFAHIYFPGGAGFSPTALVMLVSCLLLLVTTIAFVVVRVTQMAASRLRDKRNR